MRKLRIALMGLFLMGVLLGGIGTGIAFAEYTMLEYGGTKFLGEENLVTQNLDFRIPEEADVIMLEAGYQVYRYVKEIEEDRSVPVGVVRYEVTYNDQVADLQLNYRTWDTDEDVSGVLRLNSSYFADDFELFMTYKDPILNDLKEGKISNYRMEYITDIKIKVNPDTADQVRANFLY